MDPAGGYATLADLQQLVEKPTRPRVSALLQNADTLGRPRFVEREGRLYKSSRPVFSRYYWDYDAESVTITEETAENLTFTVTMQNLHTGEMLPLPAPPKRQPKAGAWPKWASLRRKPT